MNPENLYRRLLSISVLVAVTSCLSGRPLSADVWTSDERSGLGAAEKWIPIRLTPGDSSSDYFDLYSFVKKSENMRSLRKTVLFCAGGPGEVVWRGAEVNTLAGFFHKHGYDVVYFHVRGSGLSQIPPRNEFDRYLKTSYAVDDMEEVRKTFIKDKDKPWDAIIGFSYGTILAQQYASKYPELVTRLILIGPISRHNFSFSEFSESVQEIYKHSLTRIYQLKEFEHLEPAARNAIIEKVFGNRDGIFKRTEDAFGSVQFVIDAYCELGKELEQHDLNYSRNFYRSLRQLRFVGWFMTEKDEQVRIGRNLKFEVFDGLPRIENDCREEGGGQTSKRAFYVIGTYDGINPRFLKEWLSKDKTDIREALMKSGGLAHMENHVNVHIDKIGIFDDRYVRAWDPEEHKHDVPTLILKGGADPVTAGGQAEHYYSRALRGPRMLMEFPGIGHWFSLPQIPLANKSGDTSKYLSGTITFDAADIPPGEVREVHGTAAGLLVNEGYKMELQISAPMAASEVSHEGFGILEQVKVEAPDKLSNNVFARIRNRSKTYFEGGLTPWSVSNGYFSGTVYLKHTGIPPGGTRLASGTVADGKRNKERVPQFIPFNLEKDLEFLCASPYMKGEGYFLWFRNRNETRPVDGLGAYWTVKDGASGKVVRVEVDPPPLGPKETGVTGVALDEFALELDPEAKVQIEASRLEPGLEIPCTSSRSDSSTELIFYNTSESPISGLRSRDITIKNPSFDAIFEVVPPVTIQPKQSVEVPGSLKGVVWKKRIDLITPTDLEPELELLGFNIIGHNRVSALLRNNSTREVRAALRSWTYVDPQKPTPCQGGGSSRDCLIYSFLVMEPNTFNNERHNLILNLVQSSFSSKNPQESLSVKIYSCNAGECEISR